MNKARIEGWIPLAYDALKNVGIAANGSMDKSYRSQIASFGASVIMGSLIAAIAFFSKPQDNKEDGSKKNSPKVDRSKLIEAILNVLHSDGLIPETKTLDDWARDERAAGRGVPSRDAVLDAAIALKLAMNLYQLDDREGSK